MSGLRERALRIWESGQWADDGSDGSDPGYAQLGSDVNFHEEV